MRNHKRIKHQIKREKLHTETYDLSSLDFDVQNRFSNSTQWRPNHANVSLTWTLSNNNVTEIHFE